MSHDDLTSAQFWLDDASAALNNISPETENERRLVKALDFTLQALAVLLDALERAERRKQA